MSPHPDKIKTKQKLEKAIEQNFSNPLKGTYGLPWWLRR